MTACNYTPGEIDDMPFCDVLDLFAYWRDSPPTHEILKCVFGIERKCEQADTRSESDPSGIGDLMARCPDGFVRVDRLG